MNARSEHNNNDEPADDTGSSGDYDLVQDPQEHSQEPPVSPQTEMLGLGEGGEDRKAHV